MDEKEKNDAKIVTKLLRMIELSFAEQLEATHKETGLETISVYVSAKKDDRGSVYYEVRLSVSPDHYFPLEEKDDAKT